MRSDRAGHLKFLTHLPLLGWLWSSVLLKLFMQLTILSGER